MKKLISMVDFVWEQYGIRKDINSYAELTIKYATFLKQKLELWMFIPCKLVDGVWVKLSEPKEYKNWLEIQKHDGYSLCHNSNEYQKAIDRCLFKGLKLEDVQPSTTYNYYHLGWIKIFEANNQYDFFPCNGFKTVEDLTRLKEVLLTETAQKQIE